MTWRATFARLWRLLVALRWRTCKDCGWVLEKRQLVDGTAWECPECLEACRLWAIDPLGGDLSHDHENPYLGPSSSIS
jgi:hypothetical protein